MVSPITLDRFLGIVDISYERVPEGYELSILNPNLLVG